MSNSPINAGTADSAGILTTQSASSIPPYASRDALISKANGYFAQTVDRKVLTSTSAAVDGTIYLTSVGLMAGDVVSQITGFVGTGSSGYTLAKIGIYDKLGNQLAVSADQGQTWGSVSAFGGLIPTPMITPYKVTANDIYYAAFIAKASVLPSILSGTGSAPSQTESGGFPICALMLTQTDLPPVVTFTIAPTSALSKMLWMGFK